MKRINAIILTALLLTMGLGNAKAQVVDVCAGNDTVELHLGNYKYGYVQWQVSDDNETWSDIDGAVDTIYRFLPERPRFYRAEVKFPQCSEYDYHSQVTYVQVAPMADAGPDLATSPNIPVRLAASRFKGAVGEWSIIEGPPGGIFDNNNDPHALFSGSEGEYKLVWTLTNSCGSSTDTINVSCIPMVYNSNILIVDETDVILSDTLQMLNGEYSIVFTDTIPNIIEGTVLIGYREKPFLRKVTSFEKVGDVFVMQTEQATLADVVVSGAMCIDPIGDLDKKSKRVKVLERYPTRKELVANPSLLNDGSVCIIKGDYSKENMEDPEDPPINLAFNIDDGVIKMSVEINFKVFDPDLDGMKLKIEEECEPHFRVNPKYADEDMVIFSMGFYDNEVKRTTKLYAEKELNSIAMAKEKGNLNPTQLILGGFLFFGVPTTITLDFPYTAELSATIGGLEIEHTASWTSTHAVEWRGWGLEEVVKKSEPIKETKPLHITGNLEAKVEVGLKIGLLIGDAIGPSATISTNFGPSLCYSITNPHTVTAKLGWGVDSKIGGRVQLFSNRLGIDFGVHNTLFEASEKAPKELVRAGGDQQVYDPLDYNFIHSGGFLQDDIKVNVKGWFGTDMPFAIVHFEPEEGDEVSDERVTANIHGIASVKWKPGSTSGQHKLKARVYDCEGKPMAGSPLVFHAYTQGTGGCWNSGLTADFIEHVSSNGTKNIEFLVTGGEEPYEYSTDGINFNPLLQTISFVPQPGHTYVYYARDKYGCEAEAYYNAPFDACDASTFTLNIQVYNGNNIAAEAQGGIEPYLYSLDGINYSSNFGSPLPYYYFTDLVDGEYTVYAKDGLGCMRTQTVTIQREASIGIVITNAGYDMFGSPVGTVQMLASVPVIYDRGICWAEKTDAGVPPTVEDFTRSYGSGSDDYDFTLQGLNSGATYYVRAYILTDAGTAYSNIIEMMANYMVTKPYVYVTAVSSLTDNSANCSSNVINDGHAEVTDRGFCWSAINPSPTLADSHKSCGSGTGVFSGTLTGLESHTHYYIRAYATNSQGTGYGMPNQFYTSQNGGGGGTHEYVDLGLPSGTLWATCNVGATAPEGYGDFFAWGETSPKSLYYLDNYQYCNSNGELTKYCATDGLTLLCPDDDAASLNWGDGWRIPTKEEWEELYQNTTCIWTTQQDVNGLLFIANNGNSIFLPNSGFRAWNEYHSEGFRADYWSSSVLIGYERRAWNFSSCMSEYYSMDCTDRETGYPVRPVFSASLSNQLPHVLTEVYGVSIRNASCGGIIVSDGGSIVSERGICWSTNHIPTIEDNYTIAGDGTGTYTVGINGLAPSTDYYVRAYATNKLGIAYGDVKHFITKENDGTYDFEDSSLQGWTTIDGGNPSGYGWQLASSKMGVGWGRYGSTDAVISQSYENSGWGIVITPDNYLVSPSKISITSGAVISFYACAQDTIAPLEHFGVAISTASNSNASDFTTIQEWTMTTKTQGNWYNYTVDLSNYAGQEIWVAIRHFGCSDQFYLVVDDIYIGNAPGGGPTGEVPQGVINGLFSVGEDKQVYFSQGNLQHQASTNTWRFAENQWDYVGLVNSNISPTYSGWIDLFGWGTSGFNHGAVCYQPWSTSQTSNDYNAYGDPQYNLFDQTGQADWGYNAIGNGGNETSLWRTLSKDEWNYVLNTRITTSNIRYAKAKLMGINGLILIPDDWNPSIYSLNNTNQSNSNYSSNVIGDSQWEIMEQHGAVFLPAAGGRVGSEAIGYSIGATGNYWSASCSVGDMSTELNFGDGSMILDDFCDRYLGCSVRLVQDVPNGNGSGNGGGGHK